MLHVPVVAPPGMFMYRQHCLMTLAGWLAVNLLLLVSHTVDTDVYFHSRTENFCVFRRKKANKCSRVSLLYSSNYPDMFRQLTAIFRGLHVPCKLLQPGHTKRTITHIHPRRRQNWSSLQGTFNPLMMAVSCRNMSG
jgi:hypothetical protein